MTNHKPDNKDHDLRQRAEEMLKRVKDDQENLPSKDVEHLIHELQVHQIELDMQNETLRQAQLEIEMIRDRYINLYDFSPVGYLTISNKGLILEANLTFAKMMDVPRGECTAIPFSRFVAKEDADKYYLYFRQALKSTDRQTCDLRLVRKDKSYIDVRLEARVFKPGLDTDSELLLMVSDITEQIQAIKALQASEDRYRSLIENFPNGLVALYDHDLIYTFAGGMGLAQLGMRSEDLVGKRLRDVFPPEIYERDEPALLAALQGQTTDTIVPLGDEYFRVMTLPVQDEKNNVIAGMVMSQNITVLKTTESELRKANDEYNLAVDTAQMGVWKLTVDSGYLQWNDQQLQIYGLSRDEFEADLNGWRSQVHPDDVDYANSRLADVFEGKSVFDVAFRITRPNGDLRYLNASASPIYDDDGQLVEVIGINIDITNIKEIEVELRESQLFAEHVANAAPYQLYVFNFNQYQDIYLNHHGEEFFGMTLDELNAKGPSYFRELLHPDDRQIFSELQLKWESIEDGQVIEKKYRQRNADGQYRWLRSYERVFKRDPDGNPMQIIGAAVDITEGMQAEQTLIESEARYRSLFDHSSESILIADDDGNYVDANPAACELLGYSYEELIKLSLSDISPDVNHIDYQHLWQQFIKAGELSGEFTLRHKDGSHRIVDFRAVANFQPGFHLSTIRDITDRKQAEQALIESEERFRNLTETAPVGIIVCDEAGMIVTINELGEQLFGYDKSELIDQSVDILVPEVDQITHPQHRSTYVENPAPRQMGEDRVIRAKRKDGTVFPVEIALSYFQLGDQHFSTAFVVDITRRKQAESELIRANQQLVELSTRLFESQESERRRLALELHDELGQSLLILKLDLEILEENLADLGELKDRLRDSINLTNDVTEQVRTLSLQLRPSMLDDFGIQAALQWYVDSYRQRSDTQIELTTTNLDKRLPTMIETAVFRAVQEGLTNIGRYANAKTVKIDIILIDKVVKTSIQDDGVGFDLNILKDLNQRKSGGTGLSGMRERIQLLGGELEIISTPGDGTQISFSIPIAVLD